MSRITATEVKEEIKRALIFELDVKPDTVATLDAGTPLLGRGIGLDSMESLALVSAIETRFNIQIEDSELTVDLFKNVETLAELVVSRIAH